MQEILEKYYEFFLKNNLKYNNKLNEIEALNNLIIDVDDLKVKDYVYDPSKSDKYNKTHKYKPLMYEMRSFTGFFDSLNSNFESSARIPGEFSSSKIKNEEDEKRIKELFEKRRSRIMEEFKTDYENTSPFNWFKSSPNFVYHNRFIYSTKHTNNIYCKAYLSIKPEKYIDVILKIQDFVDKLYINYPDEEIGECKFRINPANDAIVLRFASKKHYEEFLNFLDNNPDIQESYDTPNLFIPRDDHGVSLLPDNGGSYNKFVAILMYNYMLKCKEENLGVSVEDFCKFIDSYDYLENGIKLIAGEGMIDYFKNILIGKLKSKPDSELLSFMNEKGENLINSEEKSSFK